MARLHARHIAASIGGQSRRVTENGVEYVVAPIVAVKEGVLNGELIYADAIGRLLDEWEDTPMTIDHPPKEFQESLSATHAWVRQNEVGRMRNVQIGQSRLKGEVWLPAGQSSEAVQKLIQRIERGETIEVSVGFLSVYVQQSGTLGTKKFREIAQDMAPNHVALLPNDVGACSIADGCGTPRVASADVRLPEFAGVESTPWQQVDRTLGAYVRAAGAALGVTVSEHAAVSELPREVRQWIADRTLLGDADAQSEEGLLRAPVVNPGTGRLNRAAVMAVFAHRVERLEIASDLKVRARQTAITLLRDNFGISIDMRIAKNKEKSNMALQAFPKINGKRIGAVLTKILDRSKGNERKNKIAQLASAAGIDAARVRAIAAGEEEFTEDRIVRTFADVLEISHGLLFSAAYGDDDDFMRALEDPPQPQPQPMGFFSDFGNALKAFKQWVGDVRNGGTKNMKRCELETRIKSAKNLSDSEAEELKSLSDAQLKMFAKGLDIEGADEFEAAPKQKEKEAPVTQAEKPVTMEAIAALLKQNNETLKTELKAEAEADKKKALTAAAKAKGLSDDEINNTPLSVLERMLPQPAARTATFAGAAGAAEQANPTSSEARIKQLVGTPNVYDIGQMTAAQKTYRQAPAVK